MATWYGSTDCQFCGTSLKGQVLIDGKTKFGPWAVMCEPCFKVNGLGLGIGKGQRYRPEGKTHYKSMT